MLAEFGVDYHVGYIDMLVFLHSKTSISYVSLDFKFICRILLKDCVIQCCLDPKTVASILLAYNRCLLS